MGGGGCAYCTAERRHGSCACDAVEAFLASSLALFAVELVEESNFGRRS
jgi:hypothetical protein